MVRNIFDFRDRTDVLKYINDPKHEIKFVRILIPDLLGRIKSLSLPTSEVSDIFSDGLTIRGQILDGNRRQNEFDLHLKPEAKSTYLIPFINKSKDGKHLWQEVFIFGDLFTLKGESFVGDSRNVLKKVLRRAKNEFKIDDFKVEPKIEFFLFPQSAANLNVKNLTQNANCYMTNKFDQIRKEIVLSLLEVGIECTIDSSKDNIFLHQINLKSKSALEIADKFMVFKYIVRIVAENNDFLASFMPKPFSDREGAGLHLSYSALSRGKDLFDDNKDSAGLSLMARRFMAGNLIHSRDISILNSQFVNSYKRLSANNEAPSHIFWGVRNTSGLLKVGQKTNSNRQNMFIKNRSADVCCNIYLAIAAQISAGLDGIKNALELDPAVNVSLLKLPRDRLETMKKLPLDFSESLNLAKNSKFLESVLGHRLYERLILEKDFELAKVSSDGGDLIGSQVSDFEIRNLLHFL